MTFEVVSTQAWNVLGTFGDESIAREAVCVATEQGTSLRDLVVYVSDDDGRPVSELGEDELAEWAQVGDSPGAPANPLLAVAVA